MKYFNLITSACLSFSLSAAVCQEQTLSPLQAKAYLLELGRIHDFDAKSAAQWAELERNSADLFPVWLECVKSTEEDLTVVHIFSLAGLSLPAKQPEVINLAVEMLTRPDADQFRSGAKDAIKLLREFGDASHLSVIRPFAKHPDPFVRQAAEAALLDLSGKVGDDRQAATQDVKNSGSRFTAPVLISGVLGLGLVFLAGWLVRKSVRRKKDH